MRKRYEFKTQYDDASGSSFYMISGQTVEGRTYRCVLDASSREEALEIFNSLPDVRNGLKVTGIRRIVHSIYWVD